MYSLNFPSRYDHYLDDSKHRSGAGALGMGFMNGGIDSDDEDDDGPNRSPHSNKHSALAAATNPQTQSTIPLSSPRPGYPVPIAALNLSRPSPAVTPDAQIQIPQALQPHMAQVPQALRTGRSPIPAPPASPRRFASPLVPSSPHPSDAPITPITPAFLRPLKTPDTVKFEDAEPIIRGNSEDHLIPKRGEKGDDFLAKV